MRKLLATLFLVLLPIAAHAQQENRAGLVNTYNSQLPTNGRELITAQDLRGVLYTLTNSITAIFGDSNVVPNNMLAQANAGTVKANITGSLGNVGDVPLASFFGSAPDASIPASAIFGSIGGGDPGFAPDGAYANLSVTDASSNVALPTGTTVVVYNKGANVAYVTLGGGAITAAVTNDVVQPSSWIAFVVGTNTNIAAIADTGLTTTLTISGGTGLPTGAGGGGSGGGGGGTVTIGPGTAAIGSLTAGTAVIGHVINDAGSAVIGHVIVDVGSTTAVNSLPPLAPGTAVIGHVIADTGSTTAVSALPALPSGTNVIGHVICDSGCGSVSVTDRATFTAGASSFVPNGGTYNVSIPTLADGQQGTVALTPTRSMHVLEDNSATTNSTLASILSGVTSAIPAGTNVIGHVIVDSGGGGGTVTLGAGSALAGKVGIDQTTPGTTNGVQVNAALPAGTNVIGHVIADTGSTTAVTALPALPSGSNVIGALTADQSVNTAQVNGVTTLTGTGATGTGSQRMTVATDTATIAGSAPGTAGSASTNVLSVQGIASGTTLGVTNTTSAANPTSTLTMVSGTGAYTAGQLIASSGTAGSIVVPSFTLPATTATIPVLRLTSNDATSTAWAAQTIRVDLWSAAPTFTNGDRGTFAVATGSAGHLAAFTCVTSPETGDGVYAECAPNIGNYALLKLGGTSVYWTLDAITGSGVTGASKVWTLTAEVLN